MTDTMNIDSLLDSTLDDLKDLPEFKNFQPGAHQVTATWGMKAINDVSYLTLDFTLMETLELADPSQENSCAPGDSCGTMYNLGNEYGQGNFKKDAAPFLAALGYTTPRELLDGGAVDIECVVITGLQKNKQDADKPYLSVKEIQIA